MRKVIATVIALMLVIGVVGCATIKMESKLEKPISMTSLRGTPVRDFVVNTRAIWLFWGLIDLSVPEFDQLVGPYAADRAGVQKLEIKTQYGVLDFFVTVLTNGVITMRSVKIEGQVFD
jgi:hypothetical protein